MLEWIRVEFVLWLHQSLLVSFVVKDCLEFLFSFLSSLLRLLLKLPLNRFSTLRGPGRHVKKSSF